MQVPALCMVRLCAVFVRGLGFRRGLRLRLGRCLGLGLCVGLALGLGRWLEGCLGLGFGLGLSLWLRLGLRLGLCLGRGGSQHICDVNFFSNGVQGGIMPLAAGLAFSEKLNETRNIIVVFIGEGFLVD